MHLGKQTQVGPKSNKRPEELGLRGCGHVCPPGCAWHTRDCGHRNNGGGAGRHPCSGVRQDSMDNAIKFCTPKPVPRPKPGNCGSLATTEARIQGGSQKSPKSAKGPGGLSLRTHLRLLKKTPDSRLMRSGEMLCLGLPTQDMMDPMVLQDSRLLPLQGK